MIEFKIIDEEHKLDINLANEPFPLIGKLALSYQNETFSYEIKLNKREDIKEMIFPDEEYNFDAMKDFTFIAAYDEDKCIALCVLEPGNFKYMHLYDLKVNSKYRKHGVAKNLIEKAKEVALTKGYKGIYTEAQDNNLGACLFYLKSGFIIGGIDTKIYSFTPQENKKDIIFYLDI